MKKKDSLVIKQYAQALRVIRERIGEDPSRNLELTGRLEPKVLGALVDVVGRHHEVLVQLEDPEFFTRRSNPTPSAHRYQAVTPVGTFLFELDFSHSGVAARNVRVSYERGLGFFFSRGE